MSILDAYRPTPGSRLLAALSDSTKAVLCPLWNLPFKRRLKMLGVAAEEFQVCRSIVKDVAILVMHNFARLKVSPNLLLHNQAVL